MGWLDRHELILFSCHAGYLEKNRASLKNKHVVEFPCSLTLKNYTAGLPCLIENQFFLFYCFFC